LGRGSRFAELSEPEFGGKFQVGVTRKISSVGPLSLWERARVREKRRNTDSQELHNFPTKSTAGYV
jgi:hypothetical protein